MVGRWWIEEGSAVRGGRQDGHAVRAVRQEVGVEEELCCVVV